MFIYNCSSQRDLVCLMTVLYHADYKRLAPMYYWRKADDSRVFINYIGG